MRTLTIYTGKSRRTSLWTRREVTWPEFRNQLTAFRVTSESLDEYLSMSREEQGAIKDVGGFVGGTLRDGIRKKANLVSRSVVTLDFDGFTATQLGQIRETFSGVCWAVYSTHKHQPHDWRVRVVLPLSRDVDPEEYVAVSRKVADMIGMAGIDRTTFEPCRLMYWPSRPMDAEHISESHDAEEYLDPDRILALYDDWRDPGQWPRTADEIDLFSLEGVPTNDPRVAQVWRELAQWSPRGRDGASGMEDPTKKTGVIGAFCRCYPISRAIAELIPGTYEHWQGDRYTYVGSSTHGGAKVYEDKWIYSHHATDPMSGREMNAWDMVRFHRFGHEDTQSRAQSVSELPSSHSMYEFASSLADVRRELGRESAERARSAFEGIEVEEPDDEEWAEWSEKEAELKNKKGKFIATRENIMAVIHGHPMLKGRLRFNEFSGQMDVTGELPWRRTGETSVFSDDDGASLRTWLETTYDVNARGKIDDALAHLRGYVTYHPVREYLESLQWDGEERLGALLPSVLGAPDTALNRQLSKLIWVTAVARVMEPGVKVDLCVTLYGPEGCGKSSLVALMAGEWFSDTPPKIGDKDGMMALRGVWMLELGEMSAMKRADMDAVKNYISSRFDTYRPSYGRHTVQVPRQTVFVATTNDPLCLRGYGDNRRFPVVEVQPGLRTEEGGVWEYVPKWRDQLWAEAVSLYRGGFSLWLPKDLDAEAREIGRRHNFDLNNPNFEIIDSYLEMRVPDTWHKLSLADRKAYVAKPNLNEDETQARRQVSTRELLTLCLDLRPGSKEYTSMAREVGQHMDRKPEWKRVRYISTDVVFGRQRGWEREGLPDDEDELEI